jgi:hypothetical protein
MATEDRQVDPATLEMSMIRFFRERNGDFLAVDTGTNRYYLDNLGQDAFEGRATAIAGLVGSVCTTCISREYLKTCKQMSKAKMPSVWLKAIGL